MVHRTPFFLPLLYPSLTWRIPTVEKELFLTFDDGPVPGPTEFVLETLSKFNALATFFCIGDNIRKHPEIFREIIHRGHAVGNHTFNHLSGWKSKTSRYQDNVLQCQQQMDTTCLGPQLGQPNLFRPPYGRITRSQIRALADFKIVMWDVLSVDYNRRLSPEQCLRNTIRATRNGSIVVFHDSLKAEKNLMAVLPGYMDHFLSRGYLFKCLTE